METEADADTQVAVDIPGRKAGRAAVILVEADTQAAAATPVDKGIPADAEIPAGGATTVVEAIPAGAAITAGATMTADGDGVTVSGIVAVAASASGTTLRRTRMGPTIITSRTTAIPTATTISGATGIPLPLAATPSHTGINGFR
jgi:hypothetical protein